MVLFSLWAEWIAHKLVRNRCSSPFKTRREAKNHLPLTDFINIFHLLKCSRWDWLAGCLTNTLKFNIFLFQPILCCRCCCTTFQRGQNLVKFLLFFVGICFFYRTLVDITACEWYRRSWFGFSNFWHQSSLAALEAVLTKRRKKCNSKMFSKLQTTCRRMEIKWTNGRTKEKAKSRLTANKIRNNVRKIVKFQCGRRRQ